MKGQRLECSAETQGSKPRLTALSVKDGQLGRVTEMLQEERWFGGETREGGFRNLEVEVPAKTSP